jgi:hypothetical protein
MLDVRGSESADNCPLSTNIRQTFLQPEQQKTSDPVWFRS